MSSPPGTVRNYGTVVATLPGPKAGNTGTGPCDMFSPEGDAVPAAWRYPAQIIRHYQAQLETVRSRFPTCRYDGGALYRMTITAEDAGGARVVDPRPAMSPARTSGQKGTTPTARTRGAAR